MQKRPVIPPIKIKTQRELQAEWDEKNKTCCITLSCCETIINKELFLSSHESWVKEKRKNNTYLFPKDAMRKIYKAYFLRQLRKMLAKKILQVKDDAAIENMIREIGFKKWNLCFYRNTSVHPAFQCPGVH